MILTDYRFLLDVHETTSQISLSFKQGDTGRVLYITLTENGDIFNIPQNCVAVFTALKPDGTIIFNDCEINGNEIVYTHTAQTAAVSGKVDCELRLYGAGNTLLTSPHFTIFVHPTVYFDQIESKDEINTLTNLISEASTKLANGEFVPKISVGTVSTLPAGSAASVEVAGTAEAPVLNFGIPMGPEGQAETLIPDTELKPDSTKPVQNLVIYNAVEEQKAAFEEHRDSKENPHAVTKSQVGLGNVDNTSDANKPVSTAQAEALGNKVDKVSGKGLSANDFTNAYKEKLDGIAAGANKYTLPVGGSAIGGVKNGGDISIASNGNMTVNDGSVTRAKLAQDALYSPMSATGSAAAYTITLNDLGKTVSPSSGASSVDVVFTLPADVSAAMPFGAEIAVLYRYGKSLKIKFESGARSAIVGDTGFVDNRTYQIPERFGMVALKKVDYSSSSNVQYWLVTGNVEVVS